MRCAEQTDIQLDPVGEKYMPNKDYSGDLFGSANDNGNVNRQRSQSPKPDQKLTCLGMTFESDNQRRDYFRSELRKLLPQLRETIGFPLGSDEDILSISDPPYYTACPNPWLGAIVAEWTAEKQLLNSQKKTGSIHQVRQPYASDVSEGKNNPIYNAHSYHTKVPHPAIMRYILHYTQPGDIVLDGFAGTGMTGVAAQLCSNPDPELRHSIEEEFRRNGIDAPVWGNRKAICSDLSPIASYIAHNYNTPLEAVEFELEAKHLLEEVRRECNWMYETDHRPKQSSFEPSGKGLINYTVWSDVFVCGNCGSDIVFWDAAVDQQQGEILDEFTCPSCGSIQTKRTTTKSFETVFDTSLAMSIRRVKAVPVLISYTFKGKRFEKSPDAGDLELLRKIEQTSLPYWFPTDELPDGDKVSDPKNKEITHAHLFYNKRELLWLSSLRHKALGSPKVFWLLISIVNTVSKLYRFVPQKPDYNGQGGGILNGTLYVPSLVRSLSVWSCLDRSLPRLCRAYFKSLKDQVVVSVNDASRYAIEDESIDYIFTDPPFGSNIMYSELNFLWESWLKIKTNSLSEAIENKTQKKSLIVYQEIMQSCFREYYRILKSGHWLTVEFSNTGAAVWNGIQTGLQRAGFVIANVAALDKKQGSFNSVTNPTSVKQDLVISCYKPSSEFDERFRVQSGEVNVWDFVAEHLSHLPISIRKDNSTTSVIERTPKILFDRLVSFYLMRNLAVPIDSAEFQNKLRSMFKETDGMIFTAQQLVEYEELKSKFGISKQLNLFLDVIYSEADGIEWLKGRLKSKPSKYQDLHADFRKANATTRRGEKEIELRTLLEENFIEGEDNTWRVPDPAEAGDRDLLRKKALMKEFSGYLTELVSAKPKRFKDVRLEALRIGFRSLWEKKDFSTLVRLADLIPQNLLMEDEMLLTYYDIAKDRV